MGATLILVGPELVGKTSLVSTLLDNYYGKETFPWRHALKGIFGVEKERVTKEGSLRISNPYKWERVSRNDILWRLEKNFFHFKVFGKTFDDMKLSKNSWYAYSGADISLLDLSGVIFYYGLYSRFIRSNSVITVVFNAAELLSSNVKVRPNTLWSGSMTNAQCLHHAMQTVHSICHVRGSGNDSSIYLPPILLVVTHYGHFIEEQIIQEITTELEGKEYAKHLVGSCEGISIALKKYCIFFDNCHKSFHQGTLYKTIVKAAQPIALKEDPFIYLKIEKTLLSMDTKIITIAKFHDIINCCGLHVEIDTTEFKGAMEYLLQHQIVMHFSSVKELHMLVLLSPTWVLKLFSYILFSHPSIKAFSEDQKHSYVLLKEKAILLKSFVLHKLELYKQSESIDTALSYEVIIALMKAFNLIGSINKESTYIVHMVEQSELLTQDEDFYIVPSLLQDAHNNSNESEEDIRIVYYNFPDKFLPESIFHQMVALCLERNVDKSQDVIW